MKLFLTGAFLFALCFFSLVIWVAIDSPLEDDDRMIYPHLREAAKKQDQELAEKNDRVEDLLKSTLDLPKSKLRRSNTTLVLWNQIKSAHIPFLSRTLVQVF